MAENSRLMMMMFVFIYLFKTVLYHYNIETFIKWNENPNNLLAFAWLISHFTPNMT